MISIINDAAVTLSSWAELSILGKATIMLSIGLTVVKLARRARASVRHLLLTATLATVFALPLVVVATPEVLIGVPAAPAVEPIRAVKPISPAPNLTAPVSASVPAPATDNAASSTISWITIIRMLWMAGATLLLLQLGVDLWRLYRIRRDGLPWPEQNDLVQSLSTEAGVRRPVEVLLHEGILAPLTYGIWRPAILLPSEAREWSVADLRRALVHELEHVRRGDWSIQLAARATCVFYWFHPLVWVAFRWLSLEAERACDDAVVRSAERTDYAEQLVLLAGRLSRAHARPALGMANRSDLSRRVAALLNASQRRGRAGFLAAASALSVASLVVLVIAPVRAVALSRTQTVGFARESGSETKTTKKRIASALDRALLEAAMDGDNTGIEELLRAGADVNAKISGDGTPLIGAAREGRLDSVRLLLDRGADPNLAVEGDGNPLIMAAREGQAGIITLLLDRGANIDQIVPGDENPLIVASGNGHLDVVKLLVARGADVNVRAWAIAEITVDVVEGKKWNQSEIELARAKILLTSKLYEKATPKELQQGEWRTPLGMARKGGHKDVVAFLEASGAKD